MESGGAERRPHDDIVLELLGSASFDAGRPPAVTLTSDAERTRVLIRDFVRDDAGPVPSLQQVSSYYRLAALAAATGLHNEAVALADRAIVLDPSHAGARLVKAASLIAAGNHKKAIGVLDEALKRDGRLAPAHLMKARSLLAREMHERAIETYKEAYAAEAAPEALVEAGGCWLALGQTEKAERLFTEARDRFPAEAVRISSAARRLAAEGRAHRSQPMLKGLLRTFADDPEIWAQMARHYAELGEPDRAVRCFEKAIALNGPDSLRKELVAAKAGMRERLRCPACSGTGDCRGCRDGNCDRCNGARKCGKCDGAGACPECDGTEDCSDCAGKGKTGLMKRCERCEGTGDCSGCEQGECPGCEDSGNCPGCAGAGKCVECSGAAKCRICKGSGVARAPGQD